MFAYYSHVYLQFHRLMALFSLKKCFRDGGDGFVVPFTTFDAPIAMITDCPSGIQQMQKMVIQIEALTIPLGL